MSRGTLERARLCILPGTTGRVAAALFATLFVLLAGCGGGWAAFTDTRTLVVDHLPASSIDVQAGNGSVSVSRGDVSACTVVATVRARSRERLEQVAVTAKRDDAGGLMVRAEWPGGPQSGEGCSFEITLPDARGVTLQTSNGAVSIGGLSGFANLTTSNGAVAVRDHAGPVTAKTSNGSITVESCDGPMDVKTSNGRIRLNDVGSAVRATSTNASISIVQRPGSAGPMQVSTSNGSVEVEVGESFVGRLKAMTTNGSVRFAVGTSGVVDSTSRRTGEAVFGAPGGDWPESQVTTSNGSITITAKNGA